MTNVDKLYELQTYRFAAYDMLLFLDTHPEDKKAFSIYRELVEKYMTLKNEYEASCGPLSPFAAAESDSFDWLSSPWPWEKEGNK